MGDGILGRIRWRAYVHGLPAAVWGGVLLALAVTPSLGPFDEMVIIDHQDKLMHFVEYLVLASLAAFALVRGTNRSREWQLRTAIVFPAAYGVLLELVQLLVPERDLSGLDMLANALGALVGGVVAMHILEPMAIRKG